MGGKVSKGAKCGKGCTLYKVVKELFPNKGKKAIDEMVEAIKEKVSGLSKADAEKALKGILPDISDQDISIIINDIIGEKISKKPKVKGSQTGADELYKRAQELQSLRNDWDKRNGTTAVMRAIDNETGKEVLLIATNSPKKSIISEFEGKLKENEVYIGGEGHAEQTIIENIGDRYTLIEGGSSRNVCKPICKPLIESKGMELGGPEFRGKEDKTKYRLFWKKK
ncbi:MAG TPA: hypothetical protein PK566_18050 [Pseudobacteroides sp.]|nr:hypothetical protein [Pseudobacteroides sp.]